MRQKGEMKNSSKTDKLCSTTRRDFLLTGLSGTMGLVVSCARDKSGKSGHEKEPKLSNIQTVTGPIPAEEMGFTLPHEHVIVDWNGGDGRSKERYDPVEVIRIMLPYLQEIKELGIQTFVDCTPPYLGRDVDVLLELSRLTGLFFVTNTGLYEKQHAPPFAFEASAEQITEMFVQEIRDGIEGTSIKAGFIKVGVSNKGPVTPNDEKIVTAACRAHTITGATINSHTFQGASALSQLDILEREHVNPSAFTYVHACFEPDIMYTIEAARRGAWVEFDSIRKETCEKHIERILTMLDKGFEDHILLSQDRGWYTVGEENGGKINAYSYLPEVFLPLLESRGVGKDLIYKLTVTNPALSFTIQHK